MPSLREHLEAYGGTGMSSADFDRCEADWYRMLDERNQAFKQYLNGMRCARYTMLSAWILTFAAIAVLLTLILS